MNLEVPKDIFLEEGQHIYFASDFHLGIDAALPAKERELQIIRWLDKVQKDAKAIFLVGDLFEFWFEYKRAIPKGYVRFLGKLAELSDMGIAIYVFTGNHDMWLFDYFPKELNIPIIRKPIQVKINGKDFFIGHGDGLGPGDYGYKTLKKIFANRFCQWLFARLHPNLGIGMAWFWSGRSRAAQKHAEIYHGDEKEWLILYTERKIQTLTIDYFIFGHRHLPIDHLLSNQKSRYLNLGEWLHYNSYAVFDGQNLKLAFFEPQKQHRIYGNNAPK